jgi:hypothetical protein
VLRRLAPLALMPSGAFAVHQLRYMLAFHSQAGVELQRQGHAYLHSLVPWLVLGIALVAGTFVRALGRAFGGCCSLPRYTMSFAALWLACSACLVAIYVSQELLEGVFATGHPAGVVGVLGYGGWWAIPAALAVGLVLAAAFHGARWVLHEVAQRRGRRVLVGRAPVAPERRRREVCVARLAPIADGWSDRGPPRCPSRRCRPFSWPSVAATAPATLLP